MFFSLTLIDINPRLVVAWKDAFMDVPAVRVVQGSILVHPADAWVTPTNARGDMGGGLDAVMKRYFGAGIEARVRRQIAAGHGGRLAVGRATCVPTAGLGTPPGGPLPRFLISTATMGGASQDVSRTDNVAWACAAALQAARMQNEAEAGSIRSIAVPGLGSSTGRVPPGSCAGQMRLAYDLLRHRRFEDFEEMHDAWSGVVAVTPAPPRRNSERRPLVVTLLGGPDRRMWRR